MTINLSEIKFEYDFFSLPMPNGDTLILNKVDENIKGTVIDSINIVVATESGSVNVPTAIGMKNPYFTLNSNYTEYLGKVLTSDNLQYCYLEISEDG